MKTLHAIVVAGLLGAGSPGHAADPVDDPWETYNRRMYAFNLKADRYVARPLGVAYDTLVPDMVQRRLTSFFANLREPHTMVSQLLQGRPGAAGKTLGRFVVNTTAGLAGTFDPASRMALARADEDLGQAFATWGWSESRYFIAPLQGPGTMRDFVGGLAARPLNPIGQIDDSGARTGVGLVQAGGVRAAALGLDGAANGEHDEYALVRARWLAQRARQIDTLR